MPATALARQPDPATVPIPDKRVRIPPKIAKAVRFLLTGECKTQKAAAERAGISPTHLCEQLAKPKIQVFIAREMRKTIAQGAMRASAKLVELVDANSEHVAAQVSERILTSEGILKSDQRAIAVNVDVKAGFILDLRDDPAPSLTTEQRASTAKPLIEQDSRQSYSPDMEK